MNLLKKAYLKQQENLKRCICCGDKFIKNRQQKYCIDCGLLTKKIYNREYIKQNRKKRFSCDKECFNCKYNDCILKEYLT